MVTIKSGKNWKPTIHVHIHVDVLETNPIIGGIAWNERERHHAACLCRIRDRDLAILPRNISRINKYITEWKGDRDRIGAIGHGESKIRKIFIVW